MNAIEIAESAALAAVADTELSGGVNMSPKETEDFVHAIGQAIQRQLWRTKWWEKQCALTHPAKGK